MSAGVILIKNFVADYCRIVTVVRRRLCLRRFFVFYLDSMFALQITFQFKINIKEK